MGFTGQRCLVISADVVVDLKVQIEDEENPVNNIAGIIFINFIVINKFEFAAAVEFLSFSGSIFAVKFSMKSIFDRKFTGQ